MRRRALPQLAVISAAILWSFDGLLRQMLYNVPPFLIISIEHVIGAVIFIPFLIKGLKAGAENLDISTLDKYLWWYVRYFFLHERP